jgi:hypothetical protein
MAAPKLFDYNSSFGLLRTNPKITGNVKVTLDSQQGVWLNSMDANPTLSDQKFKKYQVSGQNTYAKDLYKFFLDGTTNSDVIFEVGKFTDGEDKPVENFSSQYDFFYGSGASTLIDRNYTENFRYFQPLWLRNELPEFFVIFKVPGPLSYPYSTNQTVIQNGVQYKLIQDVSSTETFRISYGVDNSGTPIQYKAGEFFNGNSVYNSYSVINGSGKVVEMDELLFQPEVDDVESYFNSKILPYATAIATYDLRSTTTIGKYIRSIVNDPGYQQSPIDFSYQLNSYTYFNGVDYKNGTYTRKGELLYDYLVSSASTPQIDFEDNVTNGFSRNGIIPANVLNLEFLFNDPDSDLYTINRYFGCYVSRNDIGEFVLNGDYFYKYKDQTGNNNLPKPTKNNVGYFNSTANNFQSSTTGVRLYYDGASGWIPGSYDVNVADPQKLYYITDKNENFYSLARYENYISTTNTWSDNTPVYAQFGPFNQSETFGTTGTSGATRGNLVISDTSVNLLDFTGPGEKIGSFPGILPNSNGRANLNVEFLQQYDLTNPVTFKIIWPNGTQGDMQEKYDLIQSGEFGGVLLGWKEGSSYNIGDSHYFNFLQGTTAQIASSFSACISSISEVVWDSAPSQNSSVIRIKNSGSRENTNFKIGVFSDYLTFEALYQGIWDNVSSYAIGNIVNYRDVYYEAVSNVTAPTAGSFNSSPIDNTSDWTTYSTFSQSGYIKIGNFDASTLNRNVNFNGGTDYPKSRVAFSISEINKIVPGTWIEVESGRGVTGSVSMIESVSRYVDQPIYDGDQFKTFGTVTGFKGFNEFLVANLQDQKAIINLGSDSNFNLFEMSKLYSGVFSFFDLKDFDFDFFTSNYGQTPTPEYHRYFKLIPDQDGQIIAGTKYLVRQGQVIVDQGTVNERILQQGQAFIGTSVDYFVDYGFSNTGVDAVVVPAIFTQIGWVDPTYPYTPSTIPAEQNLNSFIGFYGIQSISETKPTPNSLDKTQVFEYGKLDTEYQYLEENFTAPRANFSRVVPFVNKWGYNGGTDARGNLYRLNSTPAFSPTNFSPSFQKDQPDPSYLTHEWMLLEGIPREFPIDSIGPQNSYLPGKVDLDLIRDANPSNNLYFSSFFTVEPTDYAAPYDNTANQTKELFTPFSFNRSTGFYDTIFRGVKISLKRRSTIPNPQSDLDKYVLNYRGFENYKFAAILRVEPEDSTTVQAPVSYEIIENVQQKSILFVTKVVIKDYRALPLGYSGITGGNPFLDYLLMYSLKDKKKDAGVGITGATGPTGSLLYEISDIKLSSALDLSIVSSSSVTTTTNPGIIYTIQNPLYDTDLREEINLFYPEGSTGSVGTTGPGSFSVPSISATYPWPISRSQSVVNFAPIQTPDYVFDIPFAFSSPVTVPVGPRSAYAGNPVFQLEGGENYFDFIMKRISVSQIFERVNTESPYITYTTYDWDAQNSVTVATVDYFQLSLSQPTAIYKPNGIYPVKSYAGPQTLGQNQPTGYVLQNGGSNYASDILRYGGGYEPLFKKIFRFKNDKNDTITRDPSIDLSFRNCTFAPEQTNFGLVQNLSYSKVSLGKNILEASQNLPEGPVFPLVGQTPIAQKDYSVFLSSWDPGYYNLYTAATSQTPVAGTRSMREYKSFLGSKMMQTPYTITIYTFITLEVSRTSGSTNVPNINAAANSAVTTIQQIGPSNSNTGIGQLGTYQSNVDLAVFDEGIFPEVEVFWQKNSLTNTVVGSIRLDRILRRYLLNSGISTVFVDNMVTEFGLGNPNNINDDINAYIEQNIAPIYEGITFDLFVKKTGQNLTSTELLVRGDLINPDRIKYAYYQQNNFQLTKRNNLSYSFEYPLTVGQNYSLTFSFRIQKI